MAAEKKPLQLEISVITANPDDFLQTNSTHLKSVPRAIFIEMVSGIDGKDVMEQVNKNKKLNFENLAVEILSTRVKKPRECCAKIKSTESTFDVGDFYDVITKYAPTVTLLAVIFQLSYDIDAYHLNKLIYDMQKYLVHESAVKMSSVDLNEWLRWKNLVNKDDIANIKNLIKHTYNLEKPMDVVDNMNSWADFINVLKLGLIPKEKTVLHFACDILGVAKCDVLFRWIISYLNSDLDTLTGVQQKKNRLMLSYEMSTVLAAY